jgi:hypothetical protein
MPPVTSSCSPAYPRNLCGPKRHSGKAQHPVTAAKPRYAPLFSLHHLLRNRQATASKAIVQQVPAVGVDGGEQDPRPDVHAVGQDGLAGPVLWKTEATYADAQEKAEGCLAEKGASTCVARVAGCGTCMEDTDHTL